MGLSYFEEKPKESAGKVRRCVACYPQGISTTSFPARLASWGMMEFVP